MDKLKLQFSDEVIRNLTEVTEFYEERQEGLGKRFAKYIEKHLLLLEEQPNIGRIGKVFGTREMVLTDFPYMIVYRVRKSYVQLLLIYHQARKYPN